MSSLLDMLCASRRLYITEDYSDNNIHMDKPKTCTSDELNAMTKEELVKLVLEHQSCAAGMCKGGKCEGGKCTGSAPASCSGTK